IRGTFDAVAIIDVLYKIPEAEWDALLARVASHLAPGGLLLIKEQDPTARVKNSWNRAQEWLVSLPRLPLRQSFTHQAPPAAPSPSLSPTNPRAPPPPASSAPASRTRGLGGSTSSIRIRTCCTSRSGNPEPKAQDLWWRRAKRATLWRAGL